MPISPSLRLAASSAVLAAMLLSACNDQPPQELLASARDYLARNDQRAAVIQIKNALQKSPDLPEGRFLLGKAFLEGGDPVAAEVELRKAIELRYAADQAVPLLARSLLAQGKAAKVLAEFAGTTLGAPASRADLLTTVGMAQALAGDNGAGQAALLKALQIQPGYGPAIVGQARIKAGEQDYPAALALLQPLLAAAPGDLEAWKLQGDILSFQGSPGPAVAAYRQALAIRPDAVTVHAALIAALVQQEKLKEAGQQLEIVKKLAPRDPKILYLEILVNFRKGDLQAAREKAQAFLRLAPDHPNTLQLAGAIEYQLKSWSQAEGYLAKALQGRPDLSLARRLLVATYLQGGQAGKALAALQPVLGKIKEDSEMLALAGQVYLQNGELQTAEHYFSRAAVLDPKNPGKRTSLAVVQLLEGHAESAFGELERIAATDPGTVADLALITSLLQRHDFGKALQAIAGLERKQPDNPLVHELRGHALYVMGDAGAARRSFERALVLNPAYFPAVAGLAGLDLAENRPEEARRRFQAVLAGDPRNVQAMLALAKLRRQMGGNPNDIAALLSRAVAAAPALAAPRLALIEHYLRNKDAGKAVSVAQDAAAVLPERPEVLDALGVAQQVAGSFNQALATYAKLAGMEPNSPRPHLRMADIHLAAGNRDEAIASLRRAQEIRPDLAEAPQRMVRLYLDAGRPDEALAVARAAQKQEPTAATGYLLEGAIRATGKKWAEAAAAYRSSLKLAANSEVAAGLHAVLLQHTGSAEAERFGNEWLTEHPQDVAFRIYLGHQALARKDLATAARHYRAVLTGQPDNAAILNNLAWVAGQQKEPQALEYAEKANRLVPDQPEFMDTLAMLLAEKGDTGRALGLLQKAVKRAPGLPQIRLNYAQVLIQAGNRQAARTELEALSRLGDKFPRQAEIAKLMGQV